MNVETWKTLRLVFYLSYLQVRGHRLFPRQLFESCHWFSFKSVRSCTFKSHFMCATCLLTNLLWSSSCQAKPSSAPPLQWLTGGGYIHPAGHPVNAPPQAVPPGELASLSSHPLPPRHQSLTVFPFLLCFSQIIPLHGRPGLKSSSALGGDRLV